MSGMALTIRSPSSVEDQAQRRVRGRVLRAEVQRPEVVLLSLRRGFVECVEHFQRHI